MPSDIIVIYNVVNFIKSFDLFLTLRMTAAHPIVHFETICSKLSLACDYTGTFAFSERTAD